MEVPSAPAGPLFEGAQFGRIDKGHGHAPANKVRCSQEWSRSARRTIRPRPRSKAPGEQIRIPTAMKRSRAHHAKIILSGLELDRLGSGRLFRMSFDPARGTP